jgi:hypothetical protein
MIEINFNANSIELSEDEKKSDKLPLMIKGLAVKSGLVKSKNFYISENELDNITNSLKTGLDGSGAYILKNHGVVTLTGQDKNTDSLVGKITDSKRSGKSVTYSGRIEDSDIATKIRKGLVNSSSIGLSVDKAYCSICNEEYGSPNCTHKLGELYPNDGLASAYQQLSDELGGSRAVIIGKGIGAKELSIVLFPAIEGASAIPMSFDEKTEKIIEETESRKTVNNDILNRKDEIEQNLANLIYKEITLDDLKAFAKDNDIVLIKREDYKNLIDMNNYLECSLWARDIGLSEQENLSQYIGLTKEQRELILTLSRKFAENKSKGHCAVDINLVDEGTKKKEDMRELIFHVRRDGKEIK